MMDVGVFEILLLLITVILGVYGYASWSYSYGKNLSVPGRKPSIPFGHFADVFLGRKVLVHKLQEFYEAYKDEPFIGYFVGFHPVLMINYRLLTSTFFAVVEYRSTKMSIVCSLIYSMSMAHGGRFFVANSHSPSRGKLKKMFYIMSECADNFERHLKAKVQMSNRIDFREQAACFTTEVIGSCAFGFDTQAIADENSVYRKIGRISFRVGLDTRIKRLLAQVSPRLYRFLRLSVHRPEVTKFILSTMREAIESRKKENIVRNDFIDLMLKIPNNEAADGFEWTNNVMAAQAFAFFAGGFETSSTALSLALWELALAPNTQEKLREEVLEFDKKNEEFSLGGV